MSGYAANVIAYHGVLEAGTHFIQKPFLPDALWIKVRDVLDARKAVDPRPPIFQGAASDYGIDEAVEATRIPGEQQGSHFALGPSPLSSSLPPT
jgi:hypothetical protein